MLTKTPAIKIGITILAIIGAVTLIAFSGMLIMHATMMHGMDSTGQMSSMCQSMVGSSR